MTACRGPLKEGFMIRAFILAALEGFPWLLRPLTEIFLGSGDGDNRGSMDPNG